MRAGHSAVHRRRFSWRGVVWMFIYPQRNARTGLTLSGLLVISLAIAIGVAAYNASSNILFLTLSLILGCIILSGILSWLNFRGLTWRIEATPPWRVGTDHPVTLVIRNEKRFLPSYAFWFEIRLARGGEVRELALKQRLDPETEIRLETTLRPSHRGAEQIELISIHSLFPFGFLRKGMALDSTESVTVWPAPVEYRRLGVHAWQRTPAAELTKRVGQGGDLLALRRYQLDDSHRQIHWKASARLRQLMVRQTAAETGQGFSLWVDTSGNRWPRPEQFELLCSLAATIAEDLFTAGRLRSAGVGLQPPHPVRRVRELELFLDQLSLAGPTPVAEGIEYDETRRWEPFPPGARRNLLVFEPDGTRGVLAKVNGETAATA